MSLPLDVFLCSIGLPHDGLVLHEKSLGGSETAAIHVARCLAARGHRVTVYAPLPERPGPVPRLLDGVWWAPIETFPQAVLAVPHSITIVSRDLNLLRQPNNSPIKVFWCHDLALKRVRQHVGPNLVNTDALYVLSAFQREQYKQVYGIPDDALVTTRNGIDLAAFTHLQNLPRDPRKLVYGSRPERGLEVALQVMDVLRARGSDLRLEVSGYDAPGLAPQMQGYYQGLFQAAAQRPNVKVLGPLTQAQWHQQLATARAMIYPGPPPMNDGFKEISGIVFGEAQACGTPSIAVPKGAIAETLNGAGILVGGEDTPCLAPAHIEAVADAVLSLDDATWATLHATGLANAAGLDWSGVAAQWEADWLARLEARSSSVERLRAHWKRIGDHEALREVAA